MRKKNSATRKLVASIALLAISATSLFGSTYAWFTMNKEVSVTGMEMKAHAEEGLLINEVAAADDTHWDEQAQGAATPTVFELRPASTADLSAWWHANSLKFGDEAGMDAINDTADVDSNHNKYTNISMSGNDTTASNETIIAAADAQGNVAKATGGSQAETHVYFSNAHFGSTQNGYDNGEGFYVNYKYYLKSSSSAAISVTDLKVAVTATLKDSTAIATDLDKAIRVGVKIGSDVLIFAPVTGGQTSYDVTSDAAGTVSDKIAVTAHDSETTINSSAVSIPAVTSDGLLVDVFVWFEGEDQNCMSKNLTATLNEYKIDITFRDADLG